MANPSADEQILKQWWSGDGTLSVQATAAMDDLVGACGSNAAWRSNYFVNDAIFSTALLVEPGITNATWYQALVDQGTGWLAGDMQGPPRWKMLKELAWEVSGGMFKDPDPGGLSSWVLSSNVGAAGVLACLGGDPDPYVRLEMINLLNAVAYPSDWQSEISRGLDQLVATIGQLPMYQTDVQVDNMLRSTLQASAANLQGKIGVQQAGIASGRLKLLPVKFPDGSAGQVLPAPSKPWWRNWRVLGAGAAGIVGGGTIALRSRS